MFCGCFDTILHKILFGIPKLFLNITFDRKRYTNLRRRAGVERRIKITAYIAVVIVAIVVLIVVGAILAVFFHVNPDFFHEMMKVNFDGSDQSQNEIQDNLPSEPVEIR